MPPTQGLSGSCGSVHEREEPATSIAFQRDVDATEPDEGRGPFSQERGTDAGVATGPATEESKAETFSESDGQYENGAVSGAGNHGGDDDAASQAMVQEVMDAPTANVVETQHDNAVVAYFKRLKGAGKPGPSWFVWTWDSIPAFVFTGITLMVLGVIEAFGLQPYDLGLQSYLPSFGASCCLVMCLLTSPGAQPRALIPTHIVGAFLGVSWSHITGSLPSPLDQQLACAFAVAILTALMMITGTFQPSASATTCLAAFHVFGQMKDQGFMFLVAPATVGPCVVVFCGWALNNLIPWRHCYPVWW